MNENKMGTVPVNKLLVGMATLMVLSMLVGAPSVAAAAEANAQ